MPLDQRLLRPRDREFTPRSLSGLYAWYDFSDASTLTVGTGISQVLDKSGNGRALVQPTAIQQPTLVGNALNGRSVASFDGSRILGHNVASDWTFLHFSTDHNAVFIALDPDVPNLTTVCRAIGTAQGFAQGQPGYNFGFNRIDGNDISVDAGIIDDDGLFPASDVLEYDSAAALNAPRVFATFCSPFTSAADLTLSDSAGTANSPSGGGEAGSLPPPGGLQLGGTNFPTPQPSYIGAICEVLIYKRPTQLTQGERASVFAYLQAKWGIA